MEAQHQNEIIEIEFVILVLAREMKEVEEMDDLPDSRFDTVAQMTYGIENKMMYGAVRFVGDGSGRLKRMK
ncbi:unnamed protein product [Lathyrus oleraceus]